MYSASKAALSHFTSGLRADFRGLPIRTTLVELGPVRTDMLAHMVEYEPTAKSFERAYLLRPHRKTPQGEGGRKGRQGSAEGPTGHVRVPKRTAVFPLMVEAPRRATEILRTGVPHQSKL